MADGAATPLTNKEAMVQLCREFGLDPSVAHPEDVMRAFYRAAGCLARVPSGWITIAADGHRVIWDQSHKPMLDDSFEFIPLYQKAIGE